MPAKTHGHAKIRNGKKWVSSPTYKTWLNMKNRCLNSNTPDYKYYGGRGVTICWEWIDDFELFLQDMGVKPEGMTLGRIDNSGPYCKENCRWESRYEQSINTRRNVMMTHNGKTQTATEWARELGIKQMTLIMRLHRGWTHERVLSTPVKRNNIPKEG